MGFEFIEIVFEGLLVLIVLAIVLNCLFSRDKAKIFSPVVFFCVYLTYYIVLPSMGSDVDFLTGKKIEGEWMLLLGAILILLAFLVGYNFRVKRLYFKKTMAVYNEDNTITIAIIVFAISFVLNGLFNGFTLSFIRYQDIGGAFNEDDAFNHAEMYLTNFISLFPAAIALLLSKKKPYIAIAFLILASIIYLIGGFRYRLLVLFVVLFVYYHLFPHPKRIKYKFWIPLVLVFYLSMGIIESTRRYGGGLDLEAIENLSEGDLSLTKARENEMVYAFSAAVMEKYSEREHIYFEPFFTAALMPIPRALFPWKPDGGYLRDANMAVYNTLEYGNAFVNISEAYMSFGWLGIILYGLVIGYLSKVFWITYKRNPNSIVSIVLLGCYNGFLYVLVSRGYLAQTFINYVYYYLLYI